MNNPTWTRIRSTTRSGVAFGSTRSEHTVEFALPPAAGVLPHMGVKAPTTLVLSSTNTTLTRGDEIKAAGRARLVAFGATAEQVYIDMTPEARSGVAFCQYFKMALWNSHEKDPLIQTTGGELTTHGEPGLQVRLSVAIAKALEAYAGFARTDRLRGVSPDKILWVLTVPSIWSDRAKHLMRQGAVDAGLIKRFNDDNLVICLEPEAVALHACLDPMSSPSVRSVFRPGNSFIVVDCGGGTVDITAHAVVSTSPLGLEQLVAPGGGPYGATAVDKRFIAFVKELIPNPRVRFLFDASAAVKLQALEAFERKKQLFDPASSRGAPMQLDMRFLCEFLEDNAVNETLADIVENFNVANRSGHPPLVTRGQSRLMIPVEYVLTFFKPSVQKILEALSDYVFRTREAQARHLILIEQDRIPVLIAGGFSQSPYLVSELRAAFPECDFMVVNNPDIAIVTGAVRYGILKATETDVVVARVMSKTYALRTLIPYVDSNAEHIQRESSVIIHDQTKFIPSMSVLVRRDEVVGTSNHSERCGPFTPLSSTQLSVAFMVYSTSRATLDYPDEQGATLVCTITIDIDMRKPYKLRTYFCELFFGGTEIRCMVYDGKDANAVPVGSGTFLYE